MTDDNLTAILEKLTATLVANLEPVDPRRIMRRYVRGIVAGALGALVLSSGVLHLNPALPQEVSLPAFWVRELYCVGLGALAILAVTRLGRPGVRLLGLLPASVAAVVFIMWILAAATLAFRRPAEPHTLAFRCDVCRVSLSDHIRLRAAVRFICVDPEGSCPDAGALGGRKPRVALQAPSVRSCIPCIVRNSPHRLSHLVSARHVYPRRDRRVPRPVAFAVVK